MRPMITRNGITSTIDETTIKQELKGNGVDIHVIKKQLQWINSIRQKEEAQTERCIGFNIDHYCRVALKDGRRTPQGRLKKICEHYRFLLDAKLTADQIVEIVQVNKEVIFEKILTEHLPWFRQHKYTDEHFVKMAIMCPSPMKEPNKSWLLDEFVTHMPVLEERCDLSKDEIVKIVVTLVGYLKTKDKKEALSQLAKSIIYGSELDSKNKESNLLPRIVCLLKRDIGGLIYWRHLFSNHQNDPTFIKEQLMAACNKDLTAQEQRSIKKNKSKRGVDSRQAKKIKSTRRASLEELHPKHFSIPAVLTLAVSDQQPRQPDDAADKIEPLCNGSPDKTLLLSSVMGTYSTYNSKQRVDEPNNHLTTERTSKSTATNHSNIATTTMEPLVDSIPLLVKTEDRLYKHYWSFLWNKPESKKDLDHSIGNCLQETNVSPTHAQYCPSAVTLNNQSMEEENKSTMEIIDDKPVPYQAFTQTNMPSIQGNDDYFAKLEAAVQQLDTEEVGYYSCQTVASCSYIHNPFLWQRSDQKDPSDLVANDSVANSRKIPRT